MFRSCQGFHLSKASSLALLKLPYPPSLHKGSFSHSPPMSVRVCPYCVLGDTIETVFQACIMATSGDALANVFRSEDEQTGPCAMTCC